jgi:hypothetical protein
LTAYSLRSLAGLLSYRQRSWDSPFGGFPSRTASEHFGSDLPTYRWLPAVFPPPKRRTGPMGPGFWGFPPWSPLPATGCLARRRPVPPLGFSLPGFSREDLGQDFARPPLSRFAPRCSPLRRRPRVSISPRLASPTCHAEAQQPRKATLLGFLHPCIPDHSNGLSVWLMDSPLAASCIAADRPTVLGRSRRSTGVVGTVLRC